MQTDPTADSPALTANTKPSPCQRLLQWSFEDLTDPVIRSNAARLALERQTAVNRLAPYIEEVVQLAWRQLQADQASVSSSRSKP